MEATAAQRLPPTIPNLLRLAWPIVVSRSTQSIVGLADAFMVAHLGDAALAATTTGAMNAFVVFILPMGTVFIVSSFASQFFGNGDAVGARRFAWYGLIVAAATLVISLALIPALGPAVSLFPMSEEVRSLLLQYLSIRFISSGAVVGLEALANYYGGLGNTRLPMIASLVSMVLNLLGNWLLIDGNLGFPRLGVAGAAWASALSTIVAFAGLFVFFLAESRKAGAGQLFPRLDRAEFLKMLRFGLPSGFNWFFEFFAFLIFVDVVVAGLGDTPLAAMMAVMQLNTVAFMPSFAVASAGAILVGQAIGAKARDEVPLAVKRTFLVAGSWQGLIGLLYLSFPRTVFAPFVRGEATAELLEFGARMLMLSAAWQLFDAAATTLAESLRAAGDTAFTLWARVALAWLVFVPGSYVSVRVLGGSEVIAMVWLMVYLGLLALILLVRFRMGAWRRFDLLHPA